MKNKSFILSIIFIFFTSTTFMLWYGEKTINNTANSGYSVFSFLNSESIIKEDSLSALTFKIENLENIDIEYDVVVYLNNEKFDTKKQLVKSRESVLIQTDKNIFEKISKNSLNKYEIVINWDSKRKNKESLKKYFNISNETSK